MGMTPLKKTKKQWRGVCTFRRSKQIKLRLISFAKPNKKWWLKESYSWTSTLSSNRYKEFPNLKVSVKKSPSSKIKFCHFKTWDKIWWTSKWQSSIWLISELSQICSIWLQARILVNSLPNSQQISKTWNLTLWIFHRLSKISQTKSKNWN